MTSLASHNARMIQPAPDEPLGARTWAALLARWLDLARAARALDGGLEDGPWQRASAPLITCQALTLALRDVPTLPVAERTLALDQATLLLRTTVADLDEAFDDQPPAVSEAVHSAESALTGAHRAMVWTILWEGPDVLCMPDIDGIPARASDDGAVAMMLPGTLALPGEPVAWWTGREEPMLGRGICGCRPVPLDRPLQVWRRFITAGDALEDVVCDIDDELAGGAMPLLVPRLAGGQRLDAPVIDEHWPPANVDVIDASIPVRWTVPWWDDDPAPGPAPTNR